MYTSGRWLLWKKRPGRWIQGRFDPSAGTIRSSPNATPIWGRSVQPHRSCRRFKLRTSLGLHRNDIFKANRRNEISAFIFDVDPVLQVQMTLQNLCAGQMPRTPNANINRCCLVQQLLALFIVGNQVIVEMEEELGHVTPATRQ